MGLHAGDVIKVVKGYVRAGLDGKPVINLGNYSAIETVPDDSSIPPIDSLTITVDAINSLQDNTVISGIVNSNPRVTDFVNPRGEASKSLSPALK